MRYFDHIYSYLTESISSARDQGLDPSEIIPSLYLYWVYSDKDVVRVEVEDIPLTLLDSMDTWNGQAHDEIDIAKADGFVFFCGLEGDGDKSQILVSIYDDFGEGSCISVLADEDKLESYIVLDIEMIIPGFGLKPH